MKKWKKKSSEIILDTPHMRVRKDIVELPPGYEKEWVYWDAGDSAMVVGMTKDCKLVMIRQYRYMVDDEVLEFPSGSLHDGESPEEGAMREFDEETSYTCHNLVKLGSFYETYGQLNRQIHIYFSDEIEQSEQRLDQGKKGFEDIKVELVNFDEAYKLVLENKVVALGSSLALLLTKEKLEK